MTTTTSRTQRSATRRPSKPAGRAILEFSKAYAEQNERDFQALAAAVDSGAVVAETGQ